MPVVRRSRTLAATPQRLWEVIGDPYHLPRWWPRVSRVEAVDEHAFTEVLVGEKGKTVRADFQRVEEESERRVLWAQQIAGTPFASVLDSAETEITLSLQEESTNTEVTIELRQDMRGFDFGRLGVGAFTRSGSHFVRRAATATVEEALDGLERAVVG